MRAEVIDRRILLIRGRKVMLDSHLAELYEVPTFRLNEAVKRNRRRFPDDFMFQLGIEREPIRGKYVHFGAPMARSSVKRMKR